MGFVKRLLFWVVFSLPLCAGLGAGVSVFWTEDGRIDMATAAFNGTTTGLWLGIFGAIVATLTNYLGRHRLRTVGGSEFFTGVIIIFGSASIGLLVLREYA